MGKKILLKQKARETPLVVGFIGLPSAGKSSIINSLVGKRILHSGVCRTTTEVHLIGEENGFGFPKDRFHEHSVKTDDGVEITILDLPGVAMRRIKEKRPILMS
jgi:ribosome biogenesis GTPase A